MYRFVEVSSHNLYTLYFILYLRFFVSIQNDIHDKLEFSSLIDCFQWLSETIGVVWFSVSFSSSAQSIPRYRFRQPKYPGRPVRQPYSYSFSSPP